MAQHIEDNSGQGHKLEKRPIIAIRQDMAPTTGITIDWMRSNWISVGPEKGSYVEYISRRELHPNKANALGRQEALLLRRSVICLR